MGKVPARCRVFIPRASSRSVFFDEQSIILARRALTSLGSMSAASISSTIQYQLPMVSSATGE